MSAGDELALQQQVSQIQDLIYERGSPKDQERILAQLTEGIRDNKSEKVEMIKYILEDLGTSVSDKEGMILSLVEKPVFEKSQLASDTLKKFGVVENTVDSRKDLIREILLNGGGGNTSSVTDAQQVARIEKEIDAIFDPSTQPKQKMLKINSLVEQCKLGKTPPQLLEKLIYYDGSSKNIQLTE